MQNDLELATKHYNESMFLFFKITLFAMVVGIVFLVWGIRTYDANNIIQAGKEWLLNDPTYEELYEGTEGVCLERFEAYGLDITKMDRSSFETVLGRLCN